jgi:hypothetical protein
MRRPDLAQVLRGACGQPIRPKVQRRKFFSREASMRTRIVLALALLLVIAGPLSADDGDAARTVIAEAIKAHGGDEALAKLHLVVRKSSGQMTISGKEVPFVEEDTAQLPERCRRETELRAEKQKLRVLIVVNGDKGWQSTGGAVLDLGNARLKELREDNYAQWLTTLLPLKKDTALRLAPLPEAKVNGEPAQGVKVSSPGHADVSLYFDKKNHLLVKSERRATEGGDDVVKEETFSGYKEFDGVKLPTRIVRTVGGKKFSETTEAAYKFPGKVEEATFGKP